MTEKVTEVSKIDNEVDEEFKKIIFALLDKYPANKSNVLTGIFKVFIKASLIINAASDTKPELLVTFFKDKIDDLRRLIGNVPSIIEDMKKDVKEQGNE